MIATVGPIPNLEPSLEVHPAADLIFVGVLALFALGFIALWRMK